MVLTSDIMGEAMSDYTYEILNSESGRVTNANARFLWQYSEPDTFDCACCGANVGVSLYGEADEHASWTEFVLMDGDGDTYSISCVDCYDALLEDLS